jgi:hypothetical protein
MLYLVLKQHNVNEACEKSMCRSREPESWTFREPEGKAVERKGIPYSNQENRASN